MTATPSTTSQLTAKLCASLPVQPASWRATPAALPLWAALFAALPLAAAAQTQTGTVYKCPGPPVQYTNQLSAQEAQEKNCKPVEGALVTVVQGTRPRAAASGAPAGANASRPGEGGRVDPAEQRARDSDARRILGEELRREEAKLAEMQREFAGGEPERRGDERNYARYQERVAAMRAAIQRKEADIAAIRRELAKLPAP
jgi:hypothetical protein